MMLLLENLMEWVWPTAHSAYVCGRKEERRLFSSQNVDLQLILEQNNHK
jgi:hypothetical protein